LSSSSCSSPCTFSITVLKALGPLNPYISSVDQIQSHWRMCF
jgi:hypothetical protein